MTDKELYTDDLFGTKTCPECNGAGEIQVQEGPLHEFTFVWESCDFCKGSGTA